MSTGRVRGGPGRKREGGGRRRTVDGSWPFRVRTSPSTPPATGDSWVGDSGSAFTASPPGGGAGLLAVDLASTLSVDAGGERAVAALSAALSDEPEPSRDESRPPSTDQ